MKLEKTFSFGKIAFYGKRRVNEVTVTVRLEDEDKGPVFSACADVWNASHTDVVACGQILGELDKFKYLGGDELFRKIHRLWKLYHLNDMHAGTPEQEAYLKEHRTGRADYSSDCALLKEAGLYEVKLDGKPYCYGERWLYRPIPEEDLAEIRKLLSE